MLRPRVNFVAVRAIPSLWRMFWPFDFLLAIAQEGFNLRVAFEGSWRSHHLAWRPCRAPRRAASREADGAALNSCQRSTKRSASHSGRTASRAPGPTNSMTWPTRSRPESSVVLAHVRIVVQ